MLTAGSDLCHITQVVVTGSSLNHISIFMQLWLVTSPNACESGVNCFSILTPVDAHIHLLTPSS